jgi:hypothetical protein
MERKSHFYGTKRIETTYILAPFVEDKRDPEPMHT